MKTCPLCRQPRCAERVSFGRQPVCHRFVEGDEPGETFPLALGYCEACGLIQLMQPMPVEQLVPRYAWVKHNEPEAHLAEVARRLAALPGVSSDSRIRGISPFEEPLFNHLRSAGFRNLERIDPQDDLDFPAGRVGIESIQARVNRVSAESIARRRGAADVVVALRILEHAHQSGEFLQGLRALARADGYVVVEVPDNRKAFKQIDVAAIWEEHISYFTLETLRGSFPLNGLKVRSIDRYPYPLEDSLVAVGQPAENYTDYPAASVLQQENSQATAYTQGLERLKKKLHRHFSDVRRSGGRIAWLGASHRGCTCINILELGEFLECVIDDDPNKQHLKMAGSRLPIRGSQVLLDPAITLCLLCINPEAEEKVMQKCEPFIERGGVFASVSPGSKHALRM